MRFHQNGRTCKKPKSNRKRIRGIPDEPMSNVLPGALKRIIPPMNLEISSRNKFKITSPSSEPGLEGRRRRTMREK